MWHTSRAPEGGFSAHHHPVASEDLPGWDRPLLRSQVGQGEDLKAEGLSSDQWQPSEQGNNYLLL